MRSAFRAGSAPVVSMLRISFAALLALGALAPTTTFAAATQRAHAERYVVNLGLMSSRDALSAEGHRDKHPANPPAGSQHVLITVDDAATGKRVSDAEVTVEITDPHGRVEKKPLLHTQPGGLPDYSELFVFGWSGKYSIRVIITPQSGKPVETRFSVNHEA